MRQKITELPKLVQKRINTLKKQGKRKSVIIFEVTDKFVECKQARKRYERYARLSIKSEKRAAKRNFIYL